jgi:hypothetical protein
MILIRAAINRTVSPQIRIRPGYDWITKKILNPRGPKSIYIIVLRCRETSLVNATKGKTIKRVQIHNRPIKDFAIKTWI